MIIRRVDSSDQLFPETFNKQNVDEELFYEDNNVVLLMSVWLIYTNYTPASQVVAPRIMCIGW